MPGGTALLGESDTVRDLLGLVQNRPRRTGSTPPPRCRMLARHSRQEDHRHEKGPDGSVSCRGGGAWLLPFRKIKGRIFGRSEDAYNDCLRNIVAYANQHGIDRILSSR